MLDVYPGVELLDRVVILFLILRNCHTVFHRAHHLFYFTYLWLCWVYTATHMGFSLVAALGFSLWGLLLLQGRGSRHTAFGSRGSRALEHRLGSCGLGA